MLLSVGDALTPGGGSSCNLPHTNKQHVYEIQERGVPGSRA